MRMDRQTREANSPFRNFAKRPKKRLRQQHPNSQPSNYKSANLTPRPRISIGQMWSGIKKTFHSILSAIFECGVLLLGHFALSESSFSRSLAASTVHAPC
jgi:hypothetical protein